MRKLFITLPLVSVIFFISSCSSNKVSPNSTPLPSQNTIALPLVNIKTAYPYIPENGAASTIIPEIETAYPPIIEESATPLPEGTLPTAPQDAPEADLGYASISGILFSYTSHQVVTDAEFFLLPIQVPVNPDNPPVIEGPDPAKGDIIGQTDNSGIISIKNIPPGNYYLVVWAPMKWALAQQSDVDTAPMLIELNDGSRLPLGVIFVAWP